MEMLVDAEPVVDHEQCEVKDSTVVVDSVDESKLQDSLINDWSKKILSESETTDRKQSITEMISLIINQKIEQKKRKQSIQSAVFELFIVYTYRGKYLKDFTIMLLQQSEIFLQNLILQSRSSAWFQ